MIVFECPSCAKGLRVKPELAGKKVKCPKCGQAVLAPAETASPVPVGNSGVGRDLPEQPTRPPQEPPPPAEAQTVPPANARTVAWQQKDETNSANKSQAAPPDESEPDSSLTDFLAPPQQPDEIGRLGMYRILKVLGAGGMGVVYKAEDPGLKRFVAIKAMLPALAAGASAKKRFLREAQAAAAIKHNHIVTIFQVGEDRGVPFLAMEFLEGEPLDERLKRETVLPTAEVLRVGREMAEGMAAAHERGLIHRDIKPPNTWLEGKKGHVKILDFGLARATDDQAHLTQSGAIIGTPAYMAPEQGRGEKLDARCDLWSLGVVLYRMCTGQVPFKGADTVSTLMAVAMNEPPPPTKVNAEVPAELSELIMKLLEKDREERIASAHEVAETLHELEQSQKAATQVTAKPSGKTRRIQKKAAAEALTRAPAATDTVSDRSKSRKPLLLALVGGLAVALIAAGAVFFWPTPGGVVRDEVNDPKAVAEQGVDLLKLIEPDKHGLSGKWTFDGPVLATPAAGMNRLQIPYAPGEEYEVRAVVERKAGDNAIVLGLIAAARPFFVAIDGWNGKHSVLFLLDGKFSKDNEAAFVHAMGPLLTVGVPTEIVCTVRHKRVTVAVAGQKIIDWQGDFKRLSADPLWAVPDARALSLGSFESMFRISKLECRTIAGEGRKLSDLPAQEPLTASIVHTFRHAGGIYCVALSDDGKHAATGSHDNTAILWDAVSGKKIQTFSGHKDSVWCVALSGDAKRVLTGSVDGTAILWDAASGQKIQTFSGHAAWIYSVSLSGDGKQALTGSKDKTAILWDAASGQKIQTYSGHADSVRSAVLSSDGKHVLTGSEKTATLWEAAGGKKIKTFEGHTSNVMCLALSQDGKYVLTGSIHDGAALWDAASGEKIQTYLHTGEMSTIALSRDARHVLTGSWDKTATLWDAASGKKTHVFNGHTDRVLGVALSGDGKRVLTGSLDKTAILWELKAAPTPWPLTGAMVQKFQGHTNQVFGVALSGDGKQILTASTDKTVILWDAASGKKKQIFPTGGGGAAVLSNDGKHVLTGSGDNTAILWDAATGNRIQTFRGHTDHVRSVVLSSDGRQIVTGSFDKTAILWDVAGGQKLQTFQGHTDKVYGVALSQDGKSALTGSKDNTAILWEAGSGKKRQNFEGHSDGVMSVALSGDGKLVLTGGDDTAILWDAASGKKKQTFRGHTGKVWFVALSRDGQRVLTGSEDKTAILWDADSGKKLQTFEGHTEDVTGVALSGDGQHVLTGSLDRSAILWEVNAAALPSAAAAWTPRTVAEWTIRRGGKVWIGDRHDIAKIEDLPAGDFDLKQVNLDNVPNLQDKDLTTIISWDGLNFGGLEFGHVELTDEGLRRLAKRGPPFPSFGASATPITGVGFDAWADQAIPTLVLIQCPNINAEGWKCIARLKAPLSALWVNGSPFTDAALAELAGRHPELQHLLAPETRLTDAAVEHLQKMKELKILDLEKTALTDAALPKLATMTQLQKINLRSTQVTAKAVEVLRKALPLCKIEWDDNAIGPGVSVP